MQESSSSPLRLLMASSSAEAPPAKKTQKTNGIASSFSALLLLCGFYGLLFLVVRRSLYSMNVDPLPYNAPLDKFSEGRTMKHIWHLAHEIGIRQVFFSLSLPHQTSISTSSPYVFSFSFRHAYFVFVLVTYKFICSQESSLRGRDPFFSHFAFTCHRSCSLSEHCKFLTFSLRIPFY